MHVGIPVIPPTFHAYFWHSPFEAILIVALLAGPLPLRRLAARFIPKFASRCPDLLQQAVQSLISLAEPGSPPDAGLRSGADVLVEGCLQDALRGLGSLCATSPPSRVSADGGRVSPEPRTKPLQLGFQYLLRCAHPFAHGVLVRYYLMLQQNRVGKKVGGDMMKVGCVARTFCRGGGKDLVSCMSTCTDPSSYMPIA